MRSGSPCTAPLRRSAFLQLLAFWFAAGLVAAGCSNRPEATGPSRGQIVAAYLEAGYSDTVAECVVGLGERAFDLQTLGRVPVEAVADAASIDPTALALGEILSSCVDAEALANPGPVDPPEELAFSDQPKARGDDPVLDGLWVACEQGSGASCDELWRNSPIGSEYEQFGVTCGNRLDVLDCTPEMDFPEADDGDN